MARKKQQVDKTTAYALAAVGVFFTFLAPFAYLALGDNDKLFSALLLWFGLLVCNALVMALTLGFWSIVAIPMMMGYSLCILWDVHTNY